MATEENPSTPTKGKAGWTDGEKLAVVMQVIAQNGANPKWDSLKLPEGRTVKAAMHVWSALKKQAESVPLVEPGSGPTRKKITRAAKPKPAGGETGVKKKRATKAKKAAELEITNDDEEMVADHKLEDSEHASVKEEDEFHLVKNEKTESDDDYN